MAIAPFWLSSCPYPDDCPHYLTHNVKKVS